VRSALFPVVGETTLRDLVREAKATETAFRSRVRTVLRSSHSTYYRRMLPRLLAALEFRSNSQAHQPLVEAVELLRAYSTRSGAVRHYAASDRVPLAGIVPADWRDAVLGDGGRVERVPYELCVLRALRDGLRRREVWVVGARRWRNPERDLPADFEDNREQHYAALRQPADPSAFIAALQQQMRTGLDRLERAQRRDTSGGVRFATRSGEPWISVPKLDKLPEPANLGRLKDAVQARWGTVDLLDLLKEADLLTGFTEELTSVASREVIPRELLRRRLLLVLFGLGTNMGLTRIAAGEHGESEAALRHVRRLFITAEGLRRAVARLVNATLAVRDTDL
jgi:Tn3 transposase DDE domain